MTDKVKEFFKKYGFYMIYVVVIFVCIEFFNRLMIDASFMNIQEVSYQEFKQLLDDDKIDTIYYNSRDEYMTFTLINSETNGLTYNERKGFKYNNRYYRKVLYPDYPEFRKEMLESGVNLEISSGRSEVLSLFSQILSLLLPVLAMFFVLRYFMRGTMGSFGLDKDGILQESDVKFENVIGQEEILDDIKFITELIKNPKIGETIGAKTPKGILLTGEPGTGKTLIAKAIAGEADVPFISMSGSDFKELYVGLGAKRVRDLFKIAREHSPCIVFIDEIDSIGASRSAHFENSEDNQTINALLKEMDGFTGREGIFILAATNHPEKLDSALKRAGRFDRQIAVNPPRDWRVRKQLLDYYLEKYQVEDSVNTENIAKQLSGFTGADIAMICNEASIIATMKEKSKIDIDSIEEAIDKKLFNGNRSKREVHNRDKEIVAYHESGHAVVTYLLKHPIARASIIASTSGVGGFVMQTETDEKLKTKEYFLEQVKICYGGRASEEIKFNDITTGASSDITQATNILAEYIEKFGFDDDFGLLDMDILKNQGMIQDNQVRIKISELSKELYKDTVKLLTNNYELVERLAKRLIEDETLSGKEVESILSSDDTEEQDA